MSLEAVPLELRQRPQWLIWRTEKRDGKATKVPYQAADPSKRASSTDPNTWGPFEAALKASEHADGLGFVFAKDDPFSGVDIDGCRNPVSGLLTPEVCAVVQRLDSYTEASASGTGVHTILKAELLGPRRRSGNFEMYADGRYFAMTGAHLAGTPETIEERQDALEALYAALFPPSPNGDAPALPPVHVDLEDRELLDVMFRSKNGAEIERLWNGDTSNHNHNHSRADASLLAHLAFYCGRDPGRMERLFDQSALGQRDKWTKRPDYKQRSIAFAIEGTTETYSPPIGKATGASAPVAAERGGSTVTRVTVAAMVVTEPASWLKRASDLLAGPDPGPTPFLVDQLAVDQAIVAIYAKAKVGKTWLALECACAIATGRPALGTFAVPKPGPVLVVLEESGEAALYRRLDALRRGNAQNVADFEHLHVAANRRVRLNDPRWQEALLTAADKIQPRAVVLDPLVRLKGAEVDENTQRELGGVLDYMRLLRDESGAAVVFVHHVGHEGTRMRGSSDLEGYWESAITVKKGDEGQRTLQAEHREAEASETVVYIADFDHATTSVRLKVIDGSPRERVVAYLADHPDASANEVFDAVGGKRAAVLKLVAEWRGDESA